MWKNPYECRLHLCYFPWSCSIFSLLHIWSSSSASFTTTCPLDCCRRDTIALLTAAEESNEHQTSFSMRTFTKPEANKKNPTFTKIVDTCAISYDKRASLLNSLRSTSLRNGSRLCCNSVVVGGSTEMSARTWEDKILYPDIKMKWSPEGKWLFKDSLFHLFFYFSQSV